MSGEQIVNDIITIINDGLNIGSFKFADIADKLLMIAGCGTFLKDMIGILNPDKPDPVMLMLFELDRKINQLSDKMAWEFDSLKAFIVENEFYAKMISLLEQESTNPLKMAMKADRLRSKATYDKWRTIIDAVITQFLFLETYINGMFWGKNMYGPNQLKSRIEALNKSMDQWRDEYKETYWDTVIAWLVHDTQDNHQDVGNAEKSNMLQSSLDQILTDDSFYLMVYNDCSGYDNHAFYGAVKQYFVSFRRGKCNVAIYRSRCFNQASEAEKKQIQFDVESCRYNTITGQTSNREVTKWLMENRIKNCRFVAMIAEGRDVEIRNVNTPGYGDGPGWWITVELMVFPIRYKLISGFN
ncbi:hypothetical protein L3Y34_009435 [Caenorhabditis briggsae]|uniref:Uncharacterized protein n=1 Tax=Caenorhabditis briggsae TaxID=6238 RepID=A0AAE9A5B5_CAEBR|nr:hypothetical protein L3Y34_009435 [Caenorhabditis briggsae]